MSNIDPNTTVEQVAVEDLDNLLGMPGADSVITPTEEKPSFFTKDSVDMSFLDKDNEVEEATISETTEETTEEPTAETTTEEPTEKTETFDNLVKEVDGIINEDSDTNIGRPKLDKEGMAQLVKELVKEELVVPFEGEENFKDYTLNDYKELIKANFDNKQSEYSKSLPHEFKNHLPPELQYAADYVFNGGEDLKGLFNYLAKAEEVKDFNTDTEKGQESIIKEYLYATKYGNEEEIQEQTEEWKDLGKLEEKAGKFKPKLDKMQEQIVQRKVADQEAKQKQQEEASYHYMTSVYDTLKDGKVGEIDINSKIQNMLYAGLVQPNYPSISGKPTNLFGHLIEKYQFVEPNHGIIAEALWLLADPNGYKDQIRSVAKNQEVQNTVRKLKTEQSSRSASAYAEESSSSDKRSTKQGIQKPNKNFFER